MLVVLIFFGVTYRPQLDAPLPPPLEIIITVCHEKGRHPLPPNRYVLFEQPQSASMLIILCYTWAGCIYFFTKLPTNSTFPRLFLV